MLDYFSNASASYQGALREARNLKRQESHLTIAILENLDTDLILKPLFDFQSKSIEHPVTYTFIQLPYREIFFYLQSKHADLAITVNDPQSPSSIQMYHVALKPIVKSHNNLFFSKNHPALKADQPPVLSDFKDSRFFLPMYYKAENAYEKEHSLPKYFPDLLGFTPKFEFLESVSSILPNIMNGDGAAILINACQIKKSSSIQSLPLANEASICFAWMQDNNNILLRQLIDNSPFET
ncbi:MAG: LysR family transcriptional regulator substrate-binding protein [Clostridiales bacterium]|nr:LysR family transcriptional regulator substrate-binding protein [Clostridiales bacterium]